MDVALWSEGAVSYTEMKSFPPRETAAVVKRLNAYLRGKARSGR